MLNKNKKFYITTSIAYTNAPPHIGFALEAVQADVLARYNRLLGKDVFFLTGTDEHGIKTLRAARDAGEEPKEFADEISEKFRELNKALNISNDDFIRTTDEKIHKPAVEKVWRKLEENDDIYKKKYRGFYCAGCEAFVTEKDLVDGKCPIHNKKPELIEEENYFFRLSKYADRIKKAIESGELKIVPETRKNETLSFINQGLEDVSFSRTKDKYWGFEVPGDPSQYLYVWCDALPNYISAIGYYKEDKKFKKYWPVDVHCLGKDIMRFHTIFWPAMLLSLGLDLPKTIFVHGFITSNGQKMSKSLGNVVDPFELIEKHGADALRYYLLREISSTEDGDFTYEKFERRYNADLAGGIGNLIARVKVMAEVVDFTKIFPDKKIIDYLTEIKIKYRNSIEDFKFNEALVCVWDIVHYCDSYINETEPWEKNKGYEQVLRNLLEALFCIGSELLPPFLPETSEKIEKEIETNKKTGKFKNERGGLLFPRI
ncbi:methionine--tRNA ligase [Patescibacteria group bacterium]|nr:methionine--tRNA ligase [Patescibacteria group bacterium]